MKIEVLTTLKGSRLWSRGTVFDDAVAPIPGDIQKELDSGSNVVRVMAENQFAVTKTEEETSFDWGKLPEPEPPKEISEVEDYLSELEGLIDNSTLKAVSEALGVPHQRVTLWRSGKKTPSASDIENIHKAFTKVI